MASTKDWFARKLGQGAPAPIQQPTPPTYPSMYPGRPLPGQTVPVETTRTLQQIAHGEEPTDWEGPVTQDNFIQAAQHYKGNVKGGLGETRTTGICPECGDTRFFSRRNGIRRGPPPAPICEACGFNGGLFEQFGNMADIVGKQNGN